MLLFTTFFWFLERVLFFISFYFLSSDWTNVFVLDLNQAPKILMELHCKVFIYCHNPIFFAIGSSQTRPSPYYSWPYDDLQLHLDYLPKTEIAFTVTIVMKNEKVRWSSPRSRRHQHVAFFIRLCYANCDNIQHFLLNLKVVNAAPQQRFSLKGDLPPEDFWINKS